MKQSTNTGINASAYRQFDLVKARQNASTLQPAAHQSAALGSLNKWFGDRSLPQRGGIVVLPTGGGKTFTAVRFLCRGPLSKNYKVLWLAHTHHLLDQANSAFAPLDEKRQQERGLEVGLIAEPKSSLNVRVVSGTAGHCKPSGIKGSDDVVIATLQTMTKAMKTLSSLPGLEEWLQNAQDLIVVFDEAHHSPATSYRELLETLRDSHPQLLLLGLTATPTHSDQSKNGWQAKLYPQSILHQISADKLMLDGILARPIFETWTTQVVPEWDEREYQKWQGKHGDLPENIITALAENRERNLLIATTYANNQEKYGKTIIFAERWYQCEQIRELLQKRGIRAGVVYSQVRGGNASEVDGKERDKGANECELDAFRRGELDVLINVRMLTEGTDVPGVQSVFLTRQTTSQILLTQMVGRALRGTKFGGTDSAYIVSFHDNWKHVVSWANPTFPTGQAGEDGAETGKTDLTGTPKEFLPFSESSSSSARPHPPLELMSIEIVRQLARATDHGDNVATAEFTSLIPVGWYAATFDTLVRPVTEEDVEDDIETVENIVLVYDRDFASYQQFIAHLQTQSLDEFTSADVTIDAMRSTVEGWQAQFFPSDRAMQAAVTQEERLRHLLDIARHMAQRVGSGADVVPPYLAFEQRQNMDLDTIARDYIRQDLGPLAKLTALRQEFQRKDCLWKIIYPTFSGFKSQYDACENYLLMVALAVPDAGTILQPLLPDAHEPVGDEMEDQGAIVLQQDERVLS